MDVKPRMLVALRQVPHLADVCARQHVLKELRSICSECRPYSDGRVTELTINFRKQIPAAHILSLLSVLSISHLRCLCVVLHLEWQGEIGVISAFISTMCISSY